MKILSLFLSLVFLSIADDYSQYEGLLMVQYSAAAYCCGTLGHGVDKWNCHVCQKLPRLETAVFSDARTDTNGYVGYDNSSNTILVVYAGTDPLSIIDWIDDLTFKQRDYASCNGCKVHDGFYVSFTSVRDSVHTSIQTFLDHHPDASIKITGHSLGAALAVLSALDIQQSFNQTVQLYTFGEPRVGNPAFAQWVNGVLPMWRVTHSHDPVPHLPLEAMNFRHHATEVFYKGSLSKGYQVCDGSGEDSTCSDRYALDVNVLDHTEYLGFDMISNYLYCKL